MGWTDAVERKAYFKKYRQTPQYRAGFNTRRNRYMRKLKVDTINAYGGECKRCGFDDIRALTIDHTDQRGCDHRDHKDRKYTGWRLYHFLKRSGFPKKGFRCLCGNCQMIVYREYKNG